MTPTPPFRYRPPVRKPSVPIVWGNALLGIMNANVLGAFLLSLVLARPNAGGGFYATAATVMIPFLMGFVAGVTWRKQPLSVGQIALLSLLTTVIGMACAYFFVKEGVVCLAMAFPLLFSIIWGAGLLGMLLGRPKGGNAPLAVSVVPMLLVAIYADCAAPVQSQTRTVTTSVVVRAPAAQVFSHLASFPPIDAKPTYYLNFLGLPYPTQTVADGAFVGAKRECRFSQNITIGERITAVVPGESVAFAITKQPVYPEFTEHGRLIRGEMTVTDNGDGTSTLSGTSYYALRVHPFWYFGWCADEAIHAVHKRVFAHITALSETR